MLGALSLNAKTKHLHQTNRMMILLCIIGAIFICVSLYANGESNSIFIPIAILASFVLIPFIKSDNLRFIFLTIANLLIMFDIFLYKIDFYDFLPLIYIVLFINAFMLSKSLINLMYAFLYLLTIYQFKASLPVELWIGNMVGIIINSIIYTFLALLISKLNNETMRMKEKELKYRTLFDFSADIVYLFELKEDFMPGKILEVNASACQKFGYSKAELLRMNPLDFTAPGRIEKIKQLQKELVEKGTISFEGKYLSKNGDLIPSEITANVFKMENKNVVLAIARDITERKRLEEKLHFLAYHDSLTGLPNRDLLKDYIHNKKQGEDLAFLFIDLDGFKLINDTMGHDYGDCLIRLAASKFSQSVGTNGLVTRFGGDEFLIVIDQATIEKASHIAEVIINAFKVPMKINEKSVSISVSIGISFALLGRDDIDNSIKEADIAMYKAKDNGKNNYYLSKETALLSAKT
jgi:diguanylate cyclase (GGDEF)-like protein/PAS domain S-box-containing protein